MSSQEYYLRSACFHSDLYYLQIMSFNKRRRQIFGFENLNRRISNGKFYNNDQKRERIQTSSFVRRSCEKSTQSPVSTSEKAACSWMASVCWEYSLAFLSHDLSRMENRRSKRKCAKYERNLDQII